MCDNIVLGGTRKILILNENQNFIKTKLVVSLSLLSLTNGFVTITEGKI